MVFIYSETVRRGKGQGKSISVQTILMYGWIHMYITKLYHILIHLCTHKQKYKHYKNPYEHIFVLAYKCSTTILDKGDDKRKLKIFVNGIILYTLYALGKF